LSPTSAPPISGGRWSRRADLQQTRSRTDAEGYRGLGEESILRGTTSSPPYLHIADIALYAYTPPGAQCDFDCRRYRGPSLVARVADQFGHIAMD